MHPTQQPQSPRTPRRDGWTAARRRQLIDHLAAGLDVRRACARVGISRVSAYRLRRREAGFARAWDEAQQAARAAAERRWLAMLPEKLRRTLSELSGECELRAAAGAAGNPVTSVRAV